MSCGCNNNNKEALIENYGPVHLHPDEYPIPNNESELHKCQTGMYPCDTFPKGFGTNDSLNCPSQGPVATNNSPNPNIRYGAVGDGAVIGTGCMNLNCMCANCHGDCRCGAAKAALPEPPAALLVAPPLQVSGLMARRFFGFSLMHLLWAALFLFLVYYVIVRKGYKRFF